MRLWLSGWSGNGYFGVLALLVVSILSKIQGLNGNLGKVSIVIKEGMGIFVKVQDIGVFWLICRGRRIEVVLGMRIRNI